MSKKILIYCGSSKGHNSVYAEQVVKLAQALHAHGCQVIFGAGSVGLIMEPWEVKHKGLPELHVTDTMHTRKALMADMADGVIAMPGGFGTLDELFEILTWKQLDLHEMPVSVFNINGYFDHQLKQIQHMVDEGILKQPNMDALQVESDPEKLADWIMAYQPEKMEKKWIYVG
jgi:predicted Rossmann-fold nucleotide-binding protein